jgi:ligand-binding sensor domain-containing protein
MRHLIYRKTIILFIAFFATLSAVAAISDYSVTHFTNENGLPQNSVRGIELDKDGFLWIATEAGLVRFDGQRFRIYDRSSDPVLRSNRITALFLDRSGILYMDSEFPEKYTFDRHRKIQWLSDQTARERSAATSTKHFRVRDNNVWYSAKGKIRWGTKIPILNYDGVFGRWGQMNNKCYYLDKQDLLWSIDTNKNIRRVSIEGLSLPQGAFNPGNKVSVALYEQDNLLYLKSEKRIYRLDETGEGTLRATSILETDLEVRYYRNYPELNLQVIGTETQGLYIFRKKQFEVRKHANGFGNYYPQAPLGDSGVLTDRGPVYPASSLFDYPFKYFINSRSLLKDSRGHYWINKGVQGENGGYYIVMLNQQLKPLKTFSTMGWANCFRETPDGRIWLCSYQGHHLGYVSGDSVQWMYGLWDKRQSVQTFLPIDNENFWVGGINILAKLNVKTRQLLHYKRLEKMSIEMLYLDKHQVLWIGTTGNGLFALKQDRIYQLPLDKNGGLKNVHTFLEDKNGFVWISTNNGLFRCKKKDLDLFIAGKTKEVYYQCFKRESGFNTNEFNGSCTPSGITLGNGKYSLPSLDGLVQFYPDSIGEALPDKKIFIDKFLVDGKEKDISHEVSLPPSFQRIEIEVVSPFFGLPDNQQLEYHVKGLDQHWYAVNNDNKIVLNRLSYGNYTLQFRKRAGFGMNNFITTSLSFNVIPFFYQTWYFKLGLILVAGLLIFLFVKIRYTYLLKRNKELEKVIIQRTAHLDNANRLKEKMLVMVGHDLQSPLHFLGHLSKINAEAVALKQHDRVEQVSQHINSTTQKISTFVEEFSLWARVQDETFNLRKTTFPISALVV